MLATIKRRLTIEASHFHQLSRDARLLLLSFAIYLATWPLFGTFINTFLWRETSTIMSLLAYNCGYFLGLPLGFVINGFAIRRFPPKTLYITGLIAHAIAPFITIFFAPSQLAPILLLGLLFGIPSGIFWANKNFISLHLTKGHNRLYYNNMENIVDICVNTTFPFIIGWFIAIAQSLTGSPIGYQVTMIIASLLLLISTLYVQRVNFPESPKTTIFPRHTTKIWQHNRLIQTVYWTQEGLAFYLPATMIMIATNNEGIVGTIDSFAAIIAASIAYLIARKTTAKNIPFLFAIGTLIYLIPAIGLYLHFSFTTVLMYSIAAGIAGLFRFTPYYSHLMDVMDDHKDDNYALVVDNELFFNLGRFLSVGIMAAVIYFASLETAIRFVPISLVLLQFTLLPFIKQVAATQHT